MDKLQEIYLEGNKISNNGIVSFSKALKVV